MGMNLIAILNACSLFLIGLGRGPPLHQGAGGYGTSRDNVRHKIVCNQAQVISDDNSIVVLNS